MKFPDLIAPRTYWGLPAPTFSWIAAAGLLLLPFSALLYLWWRVRKESKALQDATVKLERLRTRHPVDPRRGLTSATYGELADIFGKSPALMAP